MTLYFEYGRVKDPLPVQTPRLRAALLSSRSNRRLKLL